MALHYRCRHCGTKLGSLESDALTTEQLGFNQLTDEDRQEMIVYDSEGDMHVKAICEECYTSLQNNPEFYENDYIIH